MKRPLCCFALSLAILIGIFQFMPSVFQLTLCIASGVAVLFTILILKPKFIRKLIFIVLFAVFVSSGLLFTWNHCYIEPVSYFHERPSNVTGYITDLESETDYGYTYIFKSERIESGGVEYTRPFKIVLFTNDKLSAKPYERVTVSVMTKLPDEASYARDMDTRAYYKSKGVYLQASLKSELLMESSGEMAGSGLMRFALSLKEHTVDALFSSDKISYENAALSSAVTTNYKGRLSSEQKDVFAAAGLSHMLAASGMHLSILAFAILRLFGTVRIPRKISLTLCLAAVIIFSAIAGFSVSIVRAAVMFFVMALSSMLDESYDAYTSLALACAAILIHDPFAIGDAGFILSAVSTLGILLFARPLQNTLLIKRDGRVWSIVNYFIGILCITLSATAASLPFNMVIFGGISLVSPVTNILVVWLLPLMFVLCALIAVFSQFGISVIFESVLDFICRYITNVSSSLIWHPVSYAVTEGFPYYIWMAYAASVVIICAASKSIRRASAVCLVLASFICTNLFTGAYAPHYDDTGLRLTVMDAGQGQCVILQSRDKNIMIDCGTSSSGYDIGRIASEYMKKNRITNLDAVILSHYHDDHANGVGYIIANVKTKAVLMPDVSDDEGMKREIYDIAKKRNIDIIDVDSDMSIDIGGSVINIYANQMYGFDGLERSDANEKNIAVHIDFGESDILVQGDLSGEDECYLSEIHALECDVLVAAHHGSKYSTYDDFLYDVTPHIAVISSGADNSYGHPAPETLDRLSLLGTKVFRTDECGNVIIDTKGDGEFTVFTKK